ncbi:hypothetical protein D3C72_1577220 [compost metagenome]
MSLSCRRSLAASGCRASATTARQSSYSTWVSNSSVPAEIGITATSISPLRSSSSSSLARRRRMRKRAAGRSRNSRRQLATTRASGSDGEYPRRTPPCSPLRILRISARASSKSRLRRRARTRNSSPAWVRRMPVEVRSNSITPSWVSTRRTALVSEGWVMPSCSAALPTVPHC